MSMNGAGGGPLCGTLRQNTAATASGKRSAQRQAAGAPQSWPTATQRLAPRWSAMAFMSSAMMSSV